MSKAVIEKCFQELNKGMKISTGLLAQSLYKMRFQGKFNKLRFLFKKTVPYKKTVFH